jgi:hypothetical protein
LSAFAVAWQYIFQNFGDCTCNLFGNFRVSPDIISRLPSLPREPYAPDCRSYYRRKFAARSL